MTAPAGVDHPQADLETEKSDPTRVGSLRLAEGWPVALLILLLLIYRPTIGSPLWASRTALMLAALPVGAAFLLGRARSKDWAAISWLALGAWFLVSSVLSGVAGPTVVPAIGRDLSTIGLVAIAACWAIGRTTRLSAEVAGWALAVGAGLSATIAVTQLAANPSNQYLQLVDGRVPGLLVHPVWLGSVACGTAAWFAARFTGTHSWHDAAGFAGAVWLAALSGSRLPVAVAVALPLISLAIRRSKRVVMLVGALLVGLVTAELTLSLLGGGSAVTRSSDASHSATDRLNRWRLATEAWLDRPIEGWGPGRLAIGVQRHIRDAEATTYSDGAFHDAHNALLELLATTGVIGLALAAVTAVLVVRPTSGPLRWASLALMFPMLVEPTNPAMLSVAVLLLGISTEPRLSSPAIAPRAAWSLAAVGVLVAAVFTAGDAFVTRPADAVTGTSYRWFTALQRYDPRYADAVASDVYNADREGTGANLAAAWARRAVELEPDNSRWWTSLAEIHLLLDDHDAASTATDRALELQANHPRALRLALVLSADDPQRRQRRPLLEQLCAIGDQRACDG